MFCQIEETIGAPHFGGVLHSRDALGTVSSGGTRVRAHAGLQKQACPPLAPTTRDEYGRGLNDDLHACPALPLSGEIPLCTCRPLRPGLGSPPSSAGSHQTYPAAGSSLLY